MSIINQPFQGQLGDILISELKNGYTNFTIFSAFAKNSGVLRLKESIENFKSNLISRLIKHLLLISTT